MLAANLVGNVAFVFVMLQSGGFDSDHCATPVDPELAPTSNTSEIIHENKADNASIYGECIETLGRRKDIDGEAF